MNANLASSSLAKKNNNYNNNRSNYMRGSFRFQFQMQWMAPIRLAAQQVAPSRDKLCLNGATHTDSYMVGALIVGSPKAAPVLSKTEQELRPREFN